MRLRPLLFPAFLLLPLLTSAASIREAYSRYMLEGEFQYLLEFFTGQEYTGNRLVQRTDEEDRGGQYFVLHLDTRLRDLPAGTVAELEVISTESVDPELHTFPLEVRRKPRSRILYLGLTGSAWPGADTPPLAWRVVLREGDRELAEWKSFLWEMP
ncbi:MAG: hypothetical protein ACLFU2_12840 [Opitutales bacterium]